MSRGRWSSSNASTEALINYTIANLDFYRDTGVLQVRPDGMWAGPQVADLPLETDELSITQDQSEPQTKPVTLDVQETLEQPAIQIEPAPAEKPAPIIPVDAEDYITQWMNKHKAD